MVSDKQLNMIRLYERSSLKNEMATGRITRLATSNSSTPYIGGYTDLRDLDQKDQLEPRIFGA